MRLSIVLLIASACGVLGGAWLCGLLAFGIAVMVVSVAVGAFGVLWDAPGRTAPSVTGVPTLHDVLDRARRSS